MFTDKFIQSLKPKKQKYDLRERSGRGFTITVYPSGKKSFVFFYHFNKKKYRMTLGKYPYLTLRHARLLHYDALEILESGNDPRLRKQLRIHDTWDKLNIEVN